MPTANAQATLVFDSTADGNTGSWVNVSSLGSTWDLLVTGLEFTTATDFSTLSVFLSTSTTMPTSIPTTPNFVLSPGPSASAILQVTSAFNWLLVEKTPQSPLPVLGNSISVGVKVNGIAINPNTNLLYAANSTTGEVIVINALTNAIVTTITGITDAEFVTINTTTNTVYVTGAITSCFVINGATNTLTATVTIVGSTPQCPPIVNLSTNQVYIPNGSTINALNGATNTVTQYTAGGTAPSFIALNTSANTLYAIGSGALDILTASTGALLHSVNVTSPRFLTVNQLTNTVYVLGGGSNDQLFVINGTAGTLTTTITLTVIIESAITNLLQTMLSVDSLDTLYFLSSDESSKVTVFNETTNTVSTTLTIGTTTSEDPAGLVFDPVSGFLIVVCAVLAVGVVVINTSTNTIATTLAVATSAFGPVFEVLNPNNGTVFISSFSSISNEAATVLDTVVIPRALDTQATTLLEGVSGGGGTASPTTGQLWPLGG
jgi:DNA-binding beta-propeller fold protein YncE